MTNMAETKANHKKKYQPIVARWFSANVQIKILPFFAIEVRILYVFGMLIGKYTLFLAYMEEEEEDKQGTQQP